MFCILKHQANPGVIDGVMERGQGEKNELAQTPTVPVSSQKAKLEDR